MSDTDLDDYFMWRALALALRGGNQAAPNPLVGAVLVRRGSIIGTGWHRRYGAAHAEVDAISSATTDVAGSTLYVNLEPCNHYGKTPPCSHAIIEAGITRVVVAEVDSNPNVCGGGIQALREAGVQVTVGVRARQAHALNRAWHTWIRTGEPLTTLKIAMSLDGMIGIKGEARYMLSSSVSQAVVHRLRGYYQAVMVGVGTVVADNPRLYCRSNNYLQPMKVIVDSRLRIPEDARVLDLLSQESSAPTFIATTSAADPKKVERLEKRGIRILVIPSFGIQGHVDIRALLKELGKLNVISVLCEGGATLGRFLIEQGCIHEMLIFETPFWIGKRGVPFYSGNSFFPENRNALDLQSFRRCGVDLLKTYRMKRTA